jgi:hypothetical protein
MGGKMFHRLKHHSVVSLFLISLLLTACGGHVSPETPGRAASSKRVAQETESSAVGGRTEFRLLSTTDRLGVQQDGNVEIHLDHAINLYGLHVCLQFDPTKLRVKDADPAQEGIQIAPGDLPVPDFAARNLVDNERGTIDYAVVQLGPRLPATGSGVVATVQFQGVSPGVSPISFLRAELADPDGDELPVHVRDAEIEVD